MPGFITHYLFGLEVYHALTPCPLKSSIKSHKQVYSLGCEGPDLFFYYLPTLLKKDQQIGTQMHHSCVNLFFENCINEMLNMTEGFEKETIIAYLSGQLCHYMLDSIAHPYIYARTNYTLDLTGMNYFSEHCEFETFIDTNMLFLQTKKRPSEINTHRIIKATQKELNIISDYLTNCINKTYFTSKKSYISSSYVKRAMYSIIYGQFVTRDPSHKKKKKIFSLEKATIKAHILSCQVQTDFLNEELDCLNLAHNTWYSPWETSQVRNDSFVSLFRNASIRTTNLLQELNILLFQASTEKDQVKNNLLLQIGNRSYNSGLESLCEK